MLLCIPLPSHQCARHALPQAGGGCQAQRAAVALPRAGAVCDGQSGCSGVQPSAPAGRPGPAAAASRPALASGRCSSHSGSQCGGSKQCSRPGERSRRGGSSRDVCLWPALQRQLPQAGGGPVHDAAGSSPTGGSAAAGTRPAAPCVCAGHTALHISRDGSLRCKLVGLCVHAWHFRTLARPPCRPP